MIQALNTGSLPQVPSRFLRTDQAGRLVVNRQAMYSALVENNTLREDQTREIEEALTRVARRDLIAVARLRAAGLTRPLGKGVGATTYEYDKIAPVGEATQGMSILDLGDRDLVTFSRTAIPVPVTASQFRLDARHQAAGRGMGEPVDVTNVEEHTRAVAEKLEDTLTNGSDVVLGGNGLFGYTDLSARSQHSWSGDIWDVASNNSDIIQDVLDMRTALRNDGFTGPYDLHIPSNFDGVLDEDFKAESDRTVRERLQAIDGINSIFVNPALADSNVVLVQMTRSVVEMAVGQDITVVTWDEYGGLAMNWAILAVLTFALKVANARAPLSAGTLPALTTAAGIAHLS